MHKSLLVQGADCFGRFDEAVEDQRNRRRQTGLQGNTVEQLHHQRSFSNFSQQRAILMDRDDATKVGVVHLRSNGVFILQLLDEARMLLGLTQDVLERIDLPRAGIIDRIDQAARAVANQVNHLVLKNRARQGRRFQKIARRGAAHNDKTGEPRRRRRRAGGGLLPRRNSYRINTSGLPAYFTPAAPFFRFNRFIRRRSR